MIYIDPVLVSQWCDAYAQAQQDFLNNFQLYMFQHNVFIKLDYNPINYHLK